LNHREETVAGSVAFVGRPSWPNSTLIRQYLACRLGRWMTIPASAHRSMFMLRAKPRGSSFQTICHSSRSYLLIDSKTVFWVALGHGLKCRSYPTGV